MTSNKFYLIPCDSRKSFYNKAFVIRDDEGMLTLYSYNTPILSFNRGKFTRLWFGWSATTQRHINAFVNYCGYDYAGKAWFTAL